MRPESIEAGKHFAEPQRHKFIQQELKEPRNGAPKLLMPFMLRVTSKFSNFGYCAISANQKNMVILE